MRLKPVALRLGDVEKAGALRRGQPLVAVPGVEVGAD